MGLRVNNNITALIAHRNLTVVDFQLQKSIERLSSGLRINRAADDPSNFITSEQMRTQIEGISQAISNTVDSISMLQTAEGAFDQIEGLIRSMRTLALHAANTGPNDAAAIENDQTQITSAIESLSNIATTRKYGSKVLLDGSLGKVGLMAGSTSSLLSRWGIAYNFMRGGADTSVNVDFEAKNVTGTIFGTLTLVIGSEANLAKHAAAQSAVVFGGSAGGQGTIHLNVDETLTINGVQIKLTSGMNIVEARNAVNAVAALSGASAVIVSGTNTITTRGSLASFGYNSTASIGAGVLTTTVRLRFYGRNSGKAFNISVTSNQANTAGRTSGFGVSQTLLASGKDAVGNLNLRFARASGNTFTRSSIVIALTGVGNVLRAADSPISLKIFGKGNTVLNFKDLAVNLLGADISLYKASANATPQISASVTTTVAAGALSFRLRLSDAPIFFQIGPNKGEGVSQLLNNFNPNSLGFSGKLSDIDVRSQAGANTALTIVDEALNQVLIERGRLGAFQKQFLETTKDNLAVYRENYQAAESNIRDTDVASEMITFTRTQILMQSGTAMLAQANLAPQSVLQLLR